MPTARPVSSRRTAHGFIEPSACHASRCAMSAATPSGGRHGGVPGVLEPDGRRGELVGVIGAERLEPDVGVLEGDGFGEEHASSLRGILAVHGRLDRGRAGGGIARRATPRAPRRPRAGRPAARRRAPSTTKVRMPAATSSTSIGTTSASGPKTTMPIGIASAMTMPTKPNTRPWRSGSTVSCSSVIDGVEKNGTVRPNRNMNPKNTQMFGERPMPIDSAPNTSDDTMIMRDAAALGEQRRDDDAAEHHADAERDLEHREVDDVLLLAGVERAHDHERRQVGGRDGEQEDDREQHAAASARTRDGRRSARRRRGRRSSRSARRRRGARRRPGSSASRPMPIAAVTTSMKKIGMRDAARAAGRGRRPGVDRPGRGRREQRHRGLDRAVDAVHAHQVARRRDLRDQRRHRGHLDAGARRADRHRQEDEPHRVVAGHHDEREGQRR